MIQFDARIRRFLITGATMALANAYVQVYGQLSDVFDRIAEGQAPDKFTTQHLKDLGFASSNFRAVIPLLKQLGFLSPDGTPTTRYHDYRNTARSRRVMADAIREAYSARGASLDSRAKTFKEYTGFVRRIGAWRWARAGSGRSKRGCGSRTRSWHRRRGILFISV